MTTGLVGQYFAEHSGTPPTKKQHLAAIRGLFDRLVNRHAVYGWPLTRRPGEI